MSNQIARPAPCSGMPLLGQLAESRHALPQDRRAGRLVPSLLVVALLAGIAGAVLPLAEPHNSGFAWQIWPAALGVGSVLMAGFALLLLVRARVRRAESVSQCLERLFDLTFDALIATDRAGRIVLANARAERLFGRSKAELLDKHIDLVIPADDWRKHVKQPWETLSALDARVKCGDADLVGRHRDGRLLPLEAHVARLELNGSLLIVCVLRDVSERKQAEASLSEQEARLKLLMDEMPAILWTTDQKLQITSTLGKGLAELNLRPNEVIGMSLAEHLKKDDLDSTPIAAHLKALRGEGLSYEMEWMGKHFQVRVEPLRNPARIIAGTIGIVIDVTARKQAELALQRKQQEISEFFQSAAIGMHWLSPDGRVLWGNNAVLELLGYGSEEYVGRDFYDLNVDSRCAMILLQRLAREEVLRNQEVRLRTKDGRIKYVLLDTLPYKEDGELLHTRCFLRDVSDSKCLEEQLRQSQKMEAIGRLAGGIAHDFNNLLTIITGYSDLLSGTLETAHPGRELAEEIKKAGERAARLTRQLLTFSRHQVLMPEIVDLNSLVLDMQPLLRGGIGEQITLITDLDPALCAVKTDHSQMEQVLMNLAVNARDAMVSGGRLTLRTRNALLDADFIRQRPEVQPGNYVRLQVSDNGHGMDEATLARIFEPFFTTKDPGKGTGLGLATVYGIVKQSGGYIYAESAPGSGTTFSIYLPQADQEAQNALTPLPIDRPGGKETILLAEDEESLRALASQVLRQQGYHVLAARHGLDALTLVDRHEGHIDLLATDVIMPQMGGRELADKLATARPKLKVLFLSGYTDDEVLCAGLVSESTAFLPKPFSPDTLARKVREVLDA